MKPTLSRGLLQIDTGQSFTFLSEIYSVHWRLSISCLESELISAFTERLFGRLLPLGTADLFSLFAFLMLLPGLLILDYFLSVLGMSGTGAEFLKN